MAQGTYAYDVLDRRIETVETVSGVTTTTWTVFNGSSNMPFMDFNGSGTLLSRYLSGPSYIAGVDALLARTSASGTTAWYLDDMLGSVRDIASASGTVIDHIVYDAFGDIKSESSPSNGDRFKFDGMAWDAALASYYDNARYYSAGDGRFSSQDPIGFQDGSSNSYSFVGNSPPLTSDVTGLAPPDSGGSVQEATDQSESVNRLAESYSPSSVIEEQERQNKERVQQERNSAGGSQGGAPRQSPITPLAGPGPVLPISATAQEMQERLDDLRLMIKNRLDVMRSGDFLDPSVRGLLKRLHAEQRIYKARALESYNIAKEKWQAEYDALRALATFYSKQKSFGPADFATYKSQVEAEAEAYNKRKPYWNLWYSIDQSQTGKKPPSMPSRQLPEYPFPTDPS